MTDNFGRNSRRSVLVAAGSLATVGLAGCLSDDDDAEENGSGSENDDNGNDDHADVELEVFELLDRNHDDAVIAYVHDDHWDEGPLVLPADDSLSVGAYIEDDEGELDLEGTTYELAVEVSEGANEGVVDIDPDEDFHGDHVHLHATGEEDDFTTVVFQLRVDDEVVYETPDLEVEIGDGHDHAVEEFEIINRDDDEVAAYLHDDHWHGSLPSVHEGEHISLGATIVDDHGDEVELDGDHHSLGVELAEGAHEDVVSFDHLGDHVHISGEHEGTTEVVFQWIHDDHTEYQTPSIAVSVGDDHDHDDDDGHDH